MILNKIVYGFVIQRYDDEQQKFISQNFIGGEDTEWENSNGEEINAPENAGNLEIEIIQPKR